jgi:adenylate cyclase
VRRKLWPAPSASHVIRGAANTSYDVVRQPGYRGAVAALDSRDRKPIVAAAWVLVAALPLLGLGSLLLRSRLDPHWTNHRVHFMLFLGVGVVDFVLAALAAQAARRRGDARVLLISLAFLTTGGFLALHATGTPGILFSSEITGFKVAIPVGLVVAAFFAVASGFADIRPGLARAAIRHQGTLQVLVLVIMAAWFAYTVAELPPLDVPATEGAASTLLKVLAGVGTVLYGVAALRYLALYRSAPGLLPASITACFVLLAEAMIGVALTGERAWHASWWLWHGLIVVAFLVVAFAAQREWRDERFRSLYLATTRERSVDISVLFCDLAGFTGFSERSAPEEVAAMLKDYYELAAPTIARCGGEIEHFTGDGVMATFNTRGNRPDHAVRAARAALELQDAMARLAELHPTRPRLRVGVNTGDAIVREMGGHGHVAYSVLGDSVNVGARLEAHAPVGGVLIGAETYRRLPEGAVAEAMPGLQVKGKDATVDAFVLLSLPAAEERVARRFTRSRS